MKNYFEVFDLPPSFLPDKEVLRKRYFELSRQNHPDYFASADSSTQTAALQISADLNKGYKILTNQDAAIHYLLQLKGLLTDEEKYNLPPDFLLEMLEINEKVAELSFDNDAEVKVRIEEELTTIQKQIYEPVAPIIEGYREGITTEEELLQVKAYYFKKKYLTRIYEALDGMS